MPFDPDDILSRYLEWWSGDGFDTGPTAEAAFELISSGTPVDKATREVDRKARGLTVGCNPAHRCNALSLCTFLSDESLAEAAMAEARLTHYLLWRGMSLQRVLGSVGRCLAVEHGRRR